MPNRHPSGESYVSTAPPTSAAAGGGSVGITGGRGPKAAKAHPWRDNIEAIAISIISIVLFKYFVLELYRIPTGSMQPTLIGNDETGIFDRVIVDKCSFHFRDPERFEIAVFKYPLESSKNFIKRLVGMPGERLFLEGGDAFIQGKGEEPHVLRRPRAIQDAQLRRLELEGDWAPVTGGQEAAIDSREDFAALRATGSASFSFPRRESSIRDGYLDGYPRGLRKKISEKNKDSNANDVTDLRVRAHVVASSGTRSVAVVLHEGDRRFTFYLAGPAADTCSEETLRTRIEATGTGISDGDEAQVVPAKTSAAGASYVLKAGQQIELEVQNLNDLLELRVDGELLASLEIPAAVSPNSIRHVMESRVDFEISAESGAISTFEDVGIWRDIFYTKNLRSGGVTDWQIPADSYLVLGDNTQDSSDGRDWRTTRFRFLKGERAGEIIEGNSRELPQQGPESNPRFVPNRANAKQIYFRDLLGELHVLDPETVEELPREPFSFVRRDLLRGRAVLVIWPLAPQYNVYRPKWVR